jgi:hypothetical protein
VVADGGALALRDLREVRDDLLDGLVGPLGALEGAVHLVDVGLVVLVVMELHRGLVDGGLQRVVGVRKIGDGVRHVAPSDVRTGIREGFPFQILSNGLGAP